MVRVFLEIWIMRKLVEIPASYKLVNTNVKTNLQKKNSIFSTNTQGTLNGSSHLHDLNYYYYNRLAIKFIGPYLYQSIMTEKLCKKSINFKH